jgi:hypothetical protein
MRQYTWTAFVAIGALAVACGGDDDDDGKTSGTGTTTTTGTPTTSTNTTNNNTNTTNTTSSGGSGGSGGTGGSTGGTGGGTSSTGGTGGSAGDTGIGGAGGEAGMNGEGGGAGAPAMYADYCHDQCDAQAAADCANYDETMCLETCQGALLATPPQCEEAYAAYQECLAAQTWTCSGNNPDSQTAGLGCAAEEGTWVVCSFT